MDKSIRPGRIAVLALILAALLVIFFVAIYKLQIIEGNAYYEESLNSVTTTQRVRAARGNILDRYGRVLISNTSANSLMLNYSDLKAQEDPNAAILRMVQLVEEAGDEYNDDLPVTMTPPFDYTDMTALQRMLLRGYLEDAKLPEDASAVELMSSFRNRFKINNNYTAEQMRIIAGIRYALEVRTIVNTADYIFVPNASMDLITALMENGLRGFEVTTSYQRVYNTTLAPHILGYVRPMTAEQYEVYGKQGYPMDAEVGQEGAELAFEQYLHGQDGEAVITKNAAGTITGRTYTTEPIPGNNVSLTIDLDLQEAAEKALYNGIMAVRADSGYKPNIATAGALVAVDVKTGEPLAMASYPTFNLTTLFEGDNYKNLENGALVNRVTMGLYEPGSTFKPCTAMAALTSGAVSTGEYVTCDGPFTRYADTGYSPTCWVYPGSHGADNVTEAIRDSCNIFFYTMGDRMKIETLDKFAAAFGLGERTGVELPENVGRMASPEGKKLLEGASWYAGDSLQAAIGQSISQFTPLQLAEYCATVANGGTRHSASILKSVRSYDYTEQVAEAQHEVLSTVDSDPGNWAAVQQGMYLVANHPAGSAYKTFGDYYPRVACKTGTAQLGDNKANNAVFICYAPYDDPQVAIAVVVERGSAGANIAPIARELLDAYFTVKTVDFSVQSELAILP